MSNRVYESLADYMDRHPKASIVQSFASRTRQAHVVLDAVSGMYSVVYLEAGCSLRVVFYFRDGSLSRLAASEFCKYQGADDEN